MGWLLLSSLILAFSIPINKKLFGNLNPFTTALVFCTASAVFFFPFRNRKWERLSDFFTILSIGAIQFGVMYVLFQSSFFFLNSHEVALLMVTTPAYVIGIGGMFSMKWNWSIIFAAMAVLLAMLSVDFTQKFHFKWQGILLVQACNFSFALGQILLKRFCKMRHMANIFPLNFVLYAGAATVCLPMAIISQKYLPMPTFAAVDFISASLFGMLCCGVCHWFWNIGTLRTPIHVLATMNNLQIPLAVLVSCVIFGEKINMFRFVGTAIALALMLFIAILAEKIAKF
ncbi:MAG: DMT family transporter [Puniceicoccales bacterium]|jgi:drug/metabolite transporter (DMT)-like permease|nr:DMT family transporter [Puniceicoccales bacterium]